MNPLGGGRRKKEEEEDRELDVDKLLANPIVLTAEVQLFTQVVLPTVEEGGVLAAIPPHVEKPFRVEMSSEVLTDGGAIRTLRLSRRGVMFFCDGDVVECSMSLAPVTMLEAVYENNWEPADSYMALDRSPLDRQGHPIASPDVLCVLRLPSHVQETFEKLCCIFGKCTTRSARRHRDAKPISIVARHQIKAEMSKYAAKLEEEAEARRKAQEEGLIPMEGADEKRKLAEAAEAKKKADAEEAARKQALQDAEAEAAGEGLESTSTGAFLAEEEPEVIISINPFKHDLIHEPPKFNSAEDDVELTALDAEFVRQKRDTDSDAQLFIQSRAVYFGSPMNDRSTAAVDTLTALLQRGREVAALGLEADDDHEHNNSNSTKNNNPLISNKENSAGSVSPSRCKPLMTAFSYRETTRIQRAQIDAFFQDADTERRERQQKEAAQVSVLLKDLKTMTKIIETGFKDAREHKLSGIGAPRRRTPPWLKPNNTLKRPPNVPEPTMKINVDSPSGKGQVLNPFMKK